MDLFYHDTVKLIKMWQDEGKTRKDIDGDRIIAMFKAILNARTAHAYYKIANGVHIRMHAAKI